MARHSPSRRSRVSRSISDLILNVAALGGLLCIVLVALAFTMNITLIMFKTGSMSPTIPAGSVALVQKVAASTISVGDVVTVDRTGKLPITHRVTSIEPPTSGGSRTFTMRGDANPVDDVEPYTAKNVRIVRGHIPGLANIIVWFSNPLVLGAITIAAGVLVTWAFWPRDPDNDTHDDSDSIDSASESAESASTSERRAARGAPTAALVTALILSAPFGALASAEPAHAAETETHIDSTVLRLTTIGDPDLMSNLLPNVPVDWQVGVSADAPNPGLVTIGLSASGDSANTQNLTVAIESCGVRWVAGSCSIGQQELLPPQLLSDALVPQAANGTRILTTMPSAEQRWLMILVTPASTIEQGFAETLRIHADGVGDHINTDDDNDGQLPGTGFSASTPLLLALAAIIGGTFVAWLGAFRRRRKA